MATSSLSITRALFHNSHIIPASSRVGHVSPSSSSPFPWSSCTKLSGLGFSTRPCSLPETKWSPPSGNDDDLEDKQQQSGTTEESALSEGILSACLVGLITGVAVVIFNNTVHDIRDFFWDGIPSLGASWLREEPIGVVWRRVILVPVCGGVLVGLLKLLQGATESSGEVIPRSDIKDGLQSFFNTLAACVTLGTGNSLGPEGPSVEIGSSIAKGYSSLFNLSSQRSLSLLASGSAAGIASGFNAAVAGCFFAVESVLWPSPTDSSVSLPNATSMVILSAVIASIVSEVGLGSEPAFKVPGYDFRSPTELPLYLLLGLLCGLVSLALTRCTSYMLVFVENFRKSSSTPKALLPVMGGLASGLIALKYPEILYWGFENVDILLESRPYVKGLSGDVLIQLVAAKILATSLCRASGLVGGYYAPSLFIGAATGMAYGKFISLAVSQSYPIIDFSILEVASPQAYGLVGMAATLAGVCQVPLTAVLLLFELTQDYRIVLPLLGAVGVSSWITSGQMKRGYPETKKSKLQKIDTTQQSEVISNRLHGPFASSVTAMLSSENDLCEVESTLCIDYALFKNEITKRIFVSQAMRTRYVTVCNCTSLAKAVDLMLAEKQPYAAIVNEDNLLVGSLTLEDIQTFIENATGGPRKPKELLVSEMYSLEGEKCRAFWTATPSMDLHSAELIMSKHGLGHLLVISDQFQHERYPVGILDRECISLACRAIATTERLSLLTNLEDHDR